MAVDPIESDPSGFTSLVERFYAGLISTADWVPQVPILEPGISAAEASPGSEPGLGGKLLYAGDLDAEARALLVAANIAGAASLAATQDAAAGKQAVRDGVVDFLVTSLDEALRILKNELRKRETVAVCVAAATPVVESEMLERGMQPDLVARGSNDLPRFPAWLGESARQVTLAPVAEGQATLGWHVAAGSARWLPRLDALSLDYLPALDWASRRWVRLAPRYLGRMGKGVRVLTCAPEVAREFMARVQLAVQQGEIGVEVFVSLCRNGETILAHSVPPAD